MASSGKKGKKNWKVLNVNEVIDSLPPRKNWAEEIDENELDYSRKTEKVVLPTAPRSARAQEDDSTVPQDPPYMAYLTNLPYDVNEDELTNFFQDMKVNVKIKNVNLPREERSNRYKGYGYVEFEDRASFVNVLSVADTSIKGRRVRIEVSTGHGDAGRGGRGIRSGGSEPDYITQDWRSRPSREREDDSYRPGRRDYGDRGGGGYGRRDERRGGYGDRDRDRGFSDRGYGSSRDSDNRDWSRDGDRGWRDDRERDRGFGRSGGYDDRRSDYGNWRKDMDQDRDRDPPPERSEPKTRPKIALKPRTKPIEDDKDRDTSAAIFGGAKPVNTAAREREIEERLARQSASLDDGPRRRGPSSHDSWDRDRDRARERDREERGRDRGRERDYHDREYELDDDRDLESDRDIDTDRERVSSRGGDDDDDESREDDTPRRMEPAPPPKQNAWTRRSQQSSSSTVSINNGRTSPSEDADSHSKSRGTSPRPLTRDDSSSVESVRKYQPPRGQSSEQKRGDRKPSHEERNKGGPGIGRGSSSSIGGVAPSPKGSSQGSSTRSREWKKEDKDEALRMPKYQEQKAPNFAGSNKYAFLDESSETAAN
ncbi:eukaryotic translation initiation factor 4B [Lycorma delicatula]|uniref:eukaryotic translation initiation factor 4B n=1 Tax=Lycorma delicatula TaxID=130591 RepID=UPI003F5118CC